MSARQVRVETRSRHQSDLKRVMHSTARVRRWEKKWVQVGDTSMQIFKWMPIVKAEDQQNVHRDITLKTNIDQQQEITREILTSNDNHCDQSPTATPITDPATINSEPIRTTAAKNLNQSTMLLTSNQNGSHTDEQVRNNSTTTSDKIDLDSHHAEQTNKRKLNDLDMMSSDSYGSSSCSSTNDQNTLDMAQVDHERASKRQRTAAAGGDQFDTLQNFQMTVPATTSQQNLNLSSIEANNSTIGVFRQEQQQQDEKDDCMMVDEPAQVSNQNGVSTPASRDMFITEQQNEDLTSVARIVTEQIVTKVSDCYMDI